jgi:hypothetical protein
MITTMITLVVINYLILIIVRYIMGNSYTDMHISMKLLALVPCGVFIIIIGVILWMVTHKK